MTPPPTTKRAPARPGPKPKPAFDELAPPKAQSNGIHPLRALAFGEPLGRTPGTDSISESSSYVEFAWEFLRRNRYYQALIDGKKGALPETDWGYRWHHNVPRASGLVRDGAPLKPYWEAFGEGERPRWTGIDDFAAQLPPKPSLKAREEKITLRPGQALVVYDLSGLMYGRSPLQMQMYVASEHLERMASRPFPDSKTRDKPMHKRALLQRLRLFDLLNADMSLAIAAEQLGYGSREKANDGGKKASRSAKVVGGIASTLPRASSAERVADPNTTAHDDAKLAYELVYRHGYLRLLGSQTWFELSGPASRRKLTPEP